MKTVRPKIKTRYVRFRADPAEEQRWREFAKSKDTNFSEWIRNLADNAVATNDNSRELVIALKNLELNFARGIGNNLNQIVRHMNIENEFKQQEFADCVYSLKEMLELLRETLRTVRPVKSKAGL